MKYQLERFKYAKRIKNNVQKLKEKFTNKEWFDKYQPKSVFKRLIDQLNHNLKNRETYLNAVCCSLRSFYEQILLWIYIAIERNIGVHKMLIEKFITNNTHTIKNEIINKFNNGNVINSALIVDYLIFLKIDDNNLKGYHDFFKEYLNKESEIYKILNDGIHSSHRIYFLKSYSKNLKIIDKVCSLTNEFCDEINWQCFNKLNEEIMSEILMQNFTQD